MFSIQGFPISKVFDWLYLGSIDGSRNEARLKRLNVTRVVEINTFLNTCSSKQELQVSKKSCQDLKNIRDVLSIAVSDSETADIFPFFCAASAFLEEARLSTEIVFVHCFAGRQLAFSLSYILVLFVHHLSENLKTPL